MTTFSARQFASALAVLFGIGFVLCFFWGSFVSDPALKTLHMDSLRMSFLGFSGMNGVSFIVGLIQSIVWGGIVGWAAASSLNYFAKK